jgi:hypothetical protein
MLKERGPKMAGKQQREEEADSESKKKCAEKTWRQRKVFKLNERIFIDRGREDKA